MGGVISSSRPTVARVDDNPSDVSVEVIGVVLGQVVDSNAHAHMVEEVVRVPIAEVA